MFGRRIKLFKIFGFEVKIDLSWLILAVLITWSLASGLFPNYYQDLSTATYWWMGLFGMLGLVISIVAHELSHSLVARQFDMPIRGITLFIFGGVAEMNEEPTAAKGELLMALAGPFASIIVGGLFYLVHWIDFSTAWPEAVHGVLIYLAIINFILAGFNLIPAFPLDGGRVLRAALWAWKDNIQWATRIASRIGSGFGILLIALGVLNFISGNFIGGVWWFLIGLFLRGASQHSYERLLMREVLEGETVERFMKKDPVTVSPDLTLEELAENYVYEYHHKFFPVTDNDRLSGCVKVKTLKNFAREDWSQHRVNEVADACDETNTIDINDDAVKALSQMRKHNNSRLMVVQNGKLEGILTLRDLLEFLSLKVDLESDDGSPKRFKRN